MDPAARAHAWADTLDYELNIEIRSVMINDIMVWLMDNCEEATVIKTIKTLLSGIPPGRNIKFNPSLIECFGKFHKTCGKTILNHSIDAPPPDFLIPYADPRKEPSETLADTSRV